MEDIRRYWEVPAVGHFCSLFRQVFRLVDFDIEDLEEALIIDTESALDGGRSALVVDLVIGLLRGVTGWKQVSLLNYNRYLHGLLQIAWSRGANVGAPNPLGDNPDTASIHILPVYAKLKIIHWLCELRLERSDVEHLTRNLSGDSLRVNPLGYDDNGATYWYFYGTRLYKEDPDLELHNGQHLSGGSDAETSDTSTSVAPPASSRGRLRKRRGRKRGRPAKPKRARGGRTGLERAALDDSTVSATTVPSDSDTDQVSTVSRSTISSRDASPFLDTSISSTSGLPRSTAAVEGSLSMPSSGRSTPASGFGDESLNFRDMIQRMYSHNDDDDDDDEVDDGDEQRAGSDQDAFGSDMDEASNDVNGNCSFDSESINSSATITGCTVADVSIDGEWKVDFDGSVAAEHSGTPSVSCDRKEAVRPDRITPEKLSSSTLLTSTNCHCTSDAPLPGISGLPSSGSGSHRTALDSVRVTPSDAASLLGQSEVGNGFKTSATPLSAQPTHSRDQQLSLVNGSITPASYTTSDGTESHLSDTDPWDPSTSTDDSRHRLLLLHGSKSPSSAPWRQDALMPPDSSRWSLMCCTLQDWEALTDSFDDSRSKVEKELYGILKHEFLEAIAGLFEQKEKDRLDKIAELAPRRSSDRIEVKKLQREKEEQELAKREEEERRRIEQLQDEKRLRNMREQREIRLREREKEREKRRLIQEHARESRARRLQLRQKRMELQSEGKDLLAEYQLESAKPSTFDKAFDKELSDIDREIEYERMLGKLDKVFYAVQTSPDSWPFEEPVTEAIAPGYFEKVEKPMDLSTILSKIESRDYKNKQEFIGDMNLMFLNCLTYNGLDSDYTKMAHRLERMMIRAWKTCFPPSELRAYDEESRQEEIECINLLGALDRKVKFELQKSDDEDSGNSGDEQYIDESEQRRPPGRPPAHRTSPSVGKRRTPQATSATALGASTSVLVSPSVRRRLVTTTRLPSGAFRAHRIIGPGALSRPSAPSLLRPPPPRILQQKGSSSFVTHDPQSRAPVATTSSGPVFSTPGMNRNPNYDLTRPAPHVAMMNRPRFTGTGRAASISTAASTTIGPGSTPSVSGTIVRTGFRIISAGRNMVYSPKAHQTAVAGSAAGAPAGAIILAPAATSSTGTPSQQIQILTSYPNTVGGVSSGAATALAQTARVLTADTNIAVTNINALHHRLPSGGQPLTVTATDATAVGNRTNKVYCGPTAFVLTPNNASSLGLNSHQTAQLVRIGGSGTPIIVGRSTTAQLQQQPQQTQHIMHLQPTLQNSPPSQASRNILLPTTPGTPGSTLVTIPAIKTGVGGGAVGSPAQAVQLQFVQIMQPRNMVAAPSNPTLHSSVPVPVPQAQSILVPAQAVGKQTALLQNQGSMTATLAPNSFGTGVSAVQLIYNAGENSSNSLITSTQSAAICAAGQAPGGQLPSVVKQEDTAVADGSDATDETDILAEAWNSIQDT